MTNENNCIRTAPGVAAAMALPLVIILGMGASFPKVIEAQCGGSPDDPNSGQSHVSMEGGEIA